MNKHSVCSTSSRFPSAHFAGHKISLFSFGLQLSQGLCLFFPSFLVDFCRINSLINLFWQKQKKICLQVVVLF